MYKIPETREHEVSCLELRMQNDPDHVRPYESGMSFGLYHNDFEKSGDVISLRLLEDDSGEGRDLIGGWQVFSQGKLLEAISEKRSHCPGLREWPWSWREVHSGHLWKRAPLMSLSVLTMGPEQ